MTPKPTPTFDLRRAYDAMQQRRSDASEATRADPEEVRALAERPPQDEVGLARLDAILADPVTRDEYLLLRELARAESLPRRRVPVWIGAAAAVVVIVGGSFVLRPGTERDPLVRGGEEALRLVSPAESDSLLRPGREFAWTPVPTARYVVSLLDENAAVAWTVATPDTQAVLPTTIVLHAGAQYVLQVVAVLPDGVERRSTSRLLIAPP